MKEALYIDCCIRGEQSRTRKLAEAFFSALPEDYHLARVSPSEEGLQPFDRAALERRDALMAQGRLDDPRFRFAHQIAQADLVVMAAPFWDLSFPAILKVYLEHTTVEGITFASTAEGLKGLCRGKHLVFLTTRGGIYQPGGAWEQGVPYLKGIQLFYGFDAFHAIAAQGLDVQGYDGDGALRRACQEAQQLAASL